ncbi:MAG: hypothetical protein E5Y73_13340 [Mesorhizobium sp.]|nr:hypothetical protein [Mesorhizobium sp.]TIL44290.1 MAG: hypothetical protein E5Y86_17635 [Mesorhizobium sp.]TIL93399.1 MAG: hypothetical protein E5Y73_13340 [Mesorhizobium sp.]TIM42042.1 MAG: hypothetical protein E5Y56_21150 [Mesorhizobium sp.]
MSEISRICLNRLIIGIAVAAMTSGAAFAEDSSPPSQNGTSRLPNRQFKIGDTDVRISGSITFDVGAGSMKAPR